MNIHFHSGFQRINSIINLSISFFPDKTMNVIIMSVFLSVLHAYACGHNTHLCVSFFIYFSGMV